LQNITSCAENQWTDNLKGRENSLVKATGVRKKIILLKIKIIQHEKGVKNS